MLFPYFKTTSLPGLIKPMAKCSMSKVNRDLWKYEQSENFDFIYLV